MLIIRPPHNAIKPKNCRKLRWVAEGKRDVKDSVWRGMNKPWSWFQEGVFPLLSQSRATHWSAWKVKSIDPFRTRQHQKTLGNGSFSVLLTFIGRLLLPLLLLQLWRSRESICFCTSTFIVVASSAHFSPTVVWFILVYYANLVTGELESCSNRIFVTRCRWSIFWICYF